MFIYFSILLSVSLAYMEQECISFYFHSEERVYYAIFVHLFNIVSSVCENHEIVHTFFYVWMKIIGACKGNCYPILFEHLLLLLFSTSGTRKLVHKSYFVRQKTLSSSVNEGSIISVKST